MHRGFRIGALAKEFIFLDQPDFLGHAAQEQAQLLQRRKRLSNVVVSPQLHGLHGGFDRAMAGHERDFGARQELLHSFQKFQPRHSGHHHVAQNHVHRLFFQERKSGFAAFGLQAHKTQGLSNGRAELANALLIVYDEQANALIFFTVIHSAFPNVLETTSINWATRNGFSTQGAPVWRKVATVSSLAMSPVIKMIRDARSGRLREIQPYTCPPSTPPGVRMSETTPRNDPVSSSRRASTPDSQQTTGYPLRSKAACT